ncbi:MAG: ABC transporter ATP-binding protein [Nitrosopumilus sp.]|nr:ABC transporter ATP-binding protein [Nitrosopumilus sp.]
MISVRNLTKKYASAIALDDISFEVNPGETCGYIGSNGAGKSTTVKVLIGILNFDVGHILIDNIDVKVNPVEVKRIVGYVPENANLFNALSPKEYLDFIGTVRNIEKRILERRINNFAELFDFKDLVNQSIGNLYKGNKQKVLITSALLHNPRVIFLDEPLNGLDANSIFIFQDLLNFLVSRGKTIFYSSHLLNTIEKVSSKIIVIEKGKIILDMKTEDVKNSSNYTDLENLFRNLNSEGELKTYSYEGLFD